MGYGVVEDRAALVVMVVGGTMPNTRLVVGGVYDYDSFVDEEREGDWTGRNEVSGSVLGRWGRG